MRRILIIASTGLNKNSPSSARISHYVNNLKSKYIINYYNFEDKSPYWLKTPFKYITQIIPINWIIVFYSILDLILNYKISQYDLIITSIPKNEGLIIGSFLSYLYETKFIVDMRDELLYQQKLIMIRNKFSESIFLRFILLGWKYLYLILVEQPYHLCIKKSNEIVVVTNIMSNNLLSKYRLKNISIIPNGIDPEVLYGYKEDEKVEPDTDFIFIGNLNNSYYNLDKLILNLNDLNDINVKIKIIGQCNQSYLAKLDHMAAKHIEINYISTIPQNQIPHYLKRSKIGIISYPDHSDWKSAIGAKFYEYAAYGLYIIASGPTESELERICEIDSYWVFVSRSNNYKNKLEYLLYSKLLTSEKIKRSQHYSNKFSRDSLIPKWINLIEALF